MTDDSCGFVPLRLLVSGVADEFAHHLRCTPERAVDRAWRAVLQKMIDGIITCQASYWEVIVGKDNEEGVSLMGSLESGNEIPFPIWSIFTSGGIDLANSDDWVVGDFEYYETSENGERKHVIISSVKVAADALKHLFDKSEIPVEAQRAAASHRAEERRGAKRKWDWEGAICAVVAQANTPDGLPEGHGAQAEIGRILATWFRDNQGGEPAASEIGARASKIMNVVNDYRK
ncbi:MAG: hypothetical protein QM681_11945 [Novosphingobium sp.]